MCHLIFHCISSFCCSFSLPSSNIFCCRPVTYCTEIIGAGIAFLCCLKLASNNSDTIHLQPHQQLQPPKVHVINVQPQSSQKAVPQENEQSSNPWYPSWYTPSISKDAWSVAQVGYSGDVIDYDGV